MTTDFKSFKLLPAINDALEKKGYVTPTPIQAMAIPKLMAGKDLLGIAQTGTGKTAAFCLPILNRLASNRIKTKPARVRTLILTPTRELASQIEENIKLYSKGLKIFSTVIFGGVGYRNQITAMARGVDILVATPGRLLDLMNDGHVLYDQLEVFVLDEADRMLDMGFIRDIKKVVSKLPKERQTLLFSATMPDDIAHLAGNLLKNPERVEVTPQATTVEKIEQVVRYVSRLDKPHLLKTILEDKSIKSVLVFSRTKHGANRIVKHLEKVGISCAAIHGNKSQGARERALGGFRAGKLRVLVATDIAARGIDVPDVGHVINYDLPNEAESYVHRIGRTGRAGKAGIAISFCDDTELKQLKGIERLIKFKIESAEYKAPKGSAEKITPRPARKKNANFSSRRNRTTKKTTKKTSRRRDVTPRRSI